MDGKVAFMDNITMLNSHLKATAVAKNHDSAYNDRLQNIFIDIEFLVQSSRTTWTISSKMPSQPTFERDITVGILSESTNHLDNIDVIIIRHRSGIVLVVFKISDTLYVHA